MRKLLVAVATTAAIAAGCGSDDRTVAGDDGEITIEVSGFSFGTEAVEVIAGQTVTFVLKNVGTWEIGCFIADGTHWTAGMKSELVVVAA